ncbi:MerR family transcriptional regulator [Actinacidiphila sp. ITFR-21]|uniref:MerR family transcriptional regulator n=1 Tax=Actinacidiphila sp. ITFR-21 TaxID=3075199 RepID=UPI00288BE4C2|nr:MerR family transcriptional regulator [Streptomyces sp. ITFR-21]WNI16555.1 MerR family transcriptional regulator [Streptomyces sp. ITFR-21]
MSTAAEQRTYRIEDLSRLSGTTVRNIRAYTDRGLLPKPERRGRANVYGDTHLARLRQIADLLERGYTLASIKELLAAWDAGTGLGGVLGLVDEVDRPWSDERPARIGRPELTAAFGGRTDLTAIEEAIAFGVLEPVPGSEDEFLVPSPRELAVAVELHAAGVPLPAITGHLGELRGQVEHISERFLEFTTEYVFERFLHHPPTDAEAAEAAGLIRRLRPLAQQIVDAELARAMRSRATDHIRRHLGEALLSAPTAAPAPPAEPDRPENPPAGAPRPPEAALPVPVPLPPATVAAVRALVGQDHVAAFVTAATDREVATRRLTALTPRDPQ